MWCTGLVAPQHVGSSQARARTRVPCIGRWILNHCAPREAPHIHSSFFFFWPRLEACRILVPLTRGRTCAPCSGSAESQPLDLSVLYSWTFFLFFCFWPRHMACGIIIPQPGIEPGPLAVKVWSPNHWTARECPSWTLFIHSVNKSLHLLTPTSHSIPPSTSSSLATTSLFSMSVSLFLFHRYVHLCYVLDSTYK